MGRKRLGLITNTTRALGDFRAGAAAAADAVAALPSPNRRALERSRNSSARRYDRKYGPSYQIQMQCTSNRWRGKRDGAGVV
jgi:hypothetical protein